MSPTDTHQEHAARAYALLTKPLPNPQNWDPADLAVCETFRAIAHGILALYSLQEQQLQEEQEARERQRQIRKEWAAESEAIRARQADELVEQFRTGAPMFLPGPGPQIFATAMEDIAAGEMVEISSDGKLTRAGTIAEPPADITGIHMAGDEDE